MVLKAWANLPVSKNTIHALFGLPAIVVADQNMMTTNEPRESTVHTFETHARHRELR